MFTTYSKITIKQICFRITFKQSIPQLQPISICKQMLKVIKK